MRVLIDTNVLVRLMHLESRHHEAARRSLDRLRQEQAELRIVPQVIYELWAVLTRPLTANGLGFSVDQTRRVLQDVKALFAPLRDERAILEPWEQLAVSCQVLGKQVHDARLVAAMQRHGLSHLLTFNPSDFVRYPGIALLDPAALAGR